jgi:hypothetical protein
MKVSELFEASKGPDWKVLYQFKGDGEDDSDVWYGGTVTVQNYTTSEAAKAAAVKILLKKYKTQEVKVLRVSKAK